MREALSPTQQYNTAPTPIIAENPAIYKGALCLYLCGVGYFIPRRFLFASMGTPIGGREWGVPPPGQVPLRQNIFGGFSVRKQRIISLCLALALALSLAACNSQTDEQNSTQPTPSVQPTVAPTPAPTPPPIPYNDVSEDDPYFDAVVWAYKNGIASDGETFGPADTCTRGQVMTFLWRANGSPEPQTAESPFSDYAEEIVIPK